VWCWVWSAARADGHPGAAGASGEHRRCAEDEYDQEEAEAERRSSLARGHERRRGRDDVWSTGLSGAGKTTIARATARLLDDETVVLLVALLSPFRADRDAVRALHVAGRFVEVHVATPLAVCAERDVKGLYGDAAAGRVAELTGVGQDYESPERPELVLDGSAGVDVEGSARRVVERVLVTLGG
jgi:adenylylsulfate kinase